jgi:hypothetical protein
MHPHPARAAEEPGGGEGAEHSGFPWDGKSPARAVQGDRSGLTALEGPRGREL